MGFGFASFGMAVRAAGCAALVAGTAVLPAGCADTRGGDAPPADQECIRCHGGPDTPAPPVDTRGGTDTALRGVGAHEAHLGASSGLSVPVPCETCHVPVEAVGQAGHIDASPAEVVLAGAAVAPGGPAPEVVRPASDAEGFGEAAQVRCRNVYCHGATLAGGAATEPVWNSANPKGFVACGSCHGYPPPPPHPAGTGCASCHGETVGADGRIADPTKHIDAKVQGGGQACTGCHGDRDRVGNPAAPPVDTTGGSETTAIGVGAHQAHLAVKGPFKKIECGACHVVPTKSDDPGHLDPARKVVFTTLAKADGAQPAWDRETATCSGVYCHGATKAGGTLTAPVWTRVDGSQSVCGSCHGLPPPPPHPASDKCLSCHETAGPDKTIADAARHADGQVQVRISGCTTCHGSATNAAPPVDTKGASATTEVTVGAHQAHLAVKGPFRNLVCGECHVVPVTVDSPGHLDGSQKVVLAKLASANGAEPAWERSSATCNGVYCHGATLSGGSVAAPVWTRVDGTQVACGSCHGLPPPPPHPASDKCLSCHETAGPDKTIADPSRHADGQVQVRISGCTTCHGSATNAAPPVDTAGQSDKALLSVGAHQEHLVPPGPFAPVACDACHQVPADVDAPGHLGEPSVTFGGLAKADGAASPAWDPGTATCSGVYCHGATRAGGTLKEPVWTKVDGTQVVCGTCHGNPPPPPHAQNPACGTCHKETVKPDGSIKDPKKHADGTVQVVVGGCNSCHGNEDNDAPPLDTSGSDDTADVGVGAHQQHLAPPGPFAAVACEACHVVPSSVDDAGHLDAPAITFGGLSKADGADPAWDPGTAKCSGAYCHGATRAGGTLKEPVWTKVDGTQAACGACHGNPPPAPHPQSAACGICHKDAANPDGTIKDASKHADGAVQVVAGACNSCHGGDDNDAPPVDTKGSSDTSVVTVGAHQSHVAPPGPFKAVACASCHAVPSAVDDPGHLDEPTVTFSGLAKADGANPAWDPATATCKNGYCHGATLSGKVGGALVWTQPDGQAACNECHGNPPPAPHPQDAACSKCHDGGAAKPANHVDGTLQVQVACNSCHGTTADGAPPPDTTGSTAKTSVGVGAHQEHLKATSGIAAPIACGECHVVPGSAGAEGHLGPPTVTFGAKAKADGANNPTWNEGTARCSGVYCHGATLGGGKAKTPVWTTVNGSQDRCDSCHGMPPTGGTFPHDAGDHSGFECAYCHSGIVGSTSIATPATHVNGTVNKVAGFGCGMSGCH
ncbi:MAG: CxxxxCH/CxxCH domain-containing protein [Deltaproteobacteria bacterium]|nr:CxxxxCH/CxxCH domain-containing protein [Deltaproteobacteria bacterium]